MSGMESSIFYPPAQPVVELLRRPCSSNSAALARQEDAAVHGRVWRFPAAAPDWPMFADTPLFWREHSCSRAFYGHVSVELVRLRALVSELPSNLVLSTFLCIRCLIKTTLVRIVRSRFMPLLNLLYVESGLLENVAVCSCLQLRFYDFSGVEVTKLKAL